MEVLRDIAACRGMDTDDSYELEEEEDADGERFGLGPAPVTRAWGRRGGVPAARGDTAEARFPTVRLVKRRSEELDAVDSESTGSASKRARIEGAASPPDSSTPGIGSGDDDADADACAVYQDHPTVLLEQAT
ncbi:hypothetical protein DFH09DRAFT_1317006 [Mycena vulgaris]|nr:hypothetical protein DFH09DRAFT_1317006 [Mycena vulgaris]